jgi:proteasome assembly chaperone (PAC2) family protein
MKLKIDHDILGSIVDPVMIAGWPGMGGVGANAVSYMRSAMDAKEFAHIDMSDELMPSSVGVKDGLAIHNELPETHFFHVSDPSIVFVESHHQLAGSAALSLMRGVLEIAHETGAKAIFTAAAFAVPVSCESEPQIYAVANEVVLRDRLRPKGALLLEEGQISGMNGVLLGFTNGDHIPAACLMATMPQYAVSLPNPKSSRAIVRFFEKILGLEVDTTGLDQQVEEMEKVMVEIENRILSAALLISDEEETEPHRKISSQREKKRTPEHAMEKIEKLFADLGREKSKEKAAKLKAELDRWEIYDLYEDRFLDLFKEGGEETK